MNIHQFIYTNYGKFIPIMSQVSLKRGMSVWPETEEIFDFKGQSYVHFVSMNQN